MMMEKVIKLHNKQWEAFNFRNMYAAVITGKQSGKTFLGSIWAQKKISEFPQGNGLIAAPTHKILDQSTLEKFFQIFPEYRKFYKQHQSIIELPTGGRVFIRSTDNPLGLEGMTLHWAWLDEAGMMNRLVWQIIRARCAVNKGQILITTTPYMQNWLYQEFYLIWKEGRDSDYQVFSWKSIDNPYFPKDFYEKEKQRLSPQEFARIYEGEFTKMSGLVYELRDNQIIPPKEINNPEAIIAGVDWGFRNPTAIIIIKVKDRTFYLVDEFYEIEKTMDEIIHQCKIFQEKYRVNYWFPDPAEPDRIEEMRKAGLYVRNINKDIKFGISKIQQLIRENRLYVFNTCKNTIDEFNYYHYDEEKIKDEPVKENDHLMDAMRYAIVGFEPLRDLGNEIYIIQERRLNPTQFE